MIAVDSEQAWIIRRRMSDNGLNQLDVAKLVGKSRSWTGTQLLSDVEGTIWTMYQKEPDALERLSRALDWRDKFDMMLDLGVMKHDEVEAFGAAIKGLVSSADRQSQTLNPVTDVHRVPVIALASAGAPVDDSADARIIGWEYLDDEQYRAHMLVLEVDGESMNSGHADSLQHGDRLYVDTRDIRLQDSKVYVVHIHGNGIVVKRARKLGEDWWLFSDNSDFAPTRPDEASIIGRVYFHQPKGKKL